MGIAKLQGKNSEWYNKQIRLSHMKLPKFWPFFNKNDKFVRYTLYPTEQEKSLLMIFVEIILMGNRPEHERGKLQWTEQLPNLCSLQRVGSPSPQLRQPLRPLPEGEVALQGGLQTLGTNYPALGAIIDEKDARGPCRSDPHPGPHLPGSLARQGHPTSSNPAGISAHPAPSAGNPNIHLLNTSGTHDHGVPRPLPEGCPHASPGHSPPAWIWSCASPLICTLPRMSHT